MSYCELGFELVGVEQRVRIAFSPSTFLSGWGGWVGE